MRNNKSFRISLAAAGLLTTVILTGTVTAYAENQKAVLDKDSLQTKVAAARKKDRSVTKIAMSTSAEGHIAEEVGTGVYGYVDGDTFYIAPANPNETVYAPEDMSSFFSDYDAYANITSFDLSVLDTSDTTNMSFLFSGKRMMTEVNLSGWDTSNVTDMSYMFQSAEKLQTVVLGEKFDTSKVEDFSYMFQGSAITETPIEAFDFSSAICIDSMFKDCTKLTKIDFSGKTFGNEMLSISNPIGNCSSLKTFRFANVSMPGVTSWTYMFSGCNSIETIDFSGTDLSKITDVSDMFFNCTQSAFDLSFMDFSNVEMINCMFQNCTNLVEIDFSNAKFGQVKYAGNLFMSCYNLETVNLSSLEGNPVENISLMFMNCGKLKSVDLSPFEGAPIKNIGNLFSGCSSLTSVDLSPLKNAPITSMSGLVSGCSRLTEIDLNVLENAQPVYLSSLFANCTGLEKFAIDKLDMSHVEEVGSMFMGTSFTEIDLSGLRFTNLTNTYSMFQECEELITVKFPRDLMKLNNIGYMFEYCSNLEYVDLGGAIFNVDYNIGGSCSAMFRGCSSLKEFCCQKSMWDKLVEYSSDNKLDTNKVHFHQDADNDGVCDECKYMFSSEKFAKGMSLSLSDLIRFHLFVDLSVIPKLAQDPDNYLSFVMIDGKKVETDFDSATINTTVMEGKTLYDYSFGLPAYTCGYFNLYVQMKTKDGCFGEFEMIKFNEKYFDAIIQDQSGKYSKKCKTLAQNLRDYGNAAYRYFCQENKSQLTASELNTIETYRINNFPELHTPLANEHYAGMTLLLDYDLILRVYCDADFKGSTGQRGSLYFAQYRVAPYQFDVVNPISGQSVNDYIYKILSIPNEGITVEDAYLKDVCYTLHRYGVAAAAYYEEEMNK